MMVKDRPKHVVPMNL